MFGPTDTMNDPQLTIHDLWLVLCSVLVFCMQLGFAMIETGVVRPKNTINVAMKNLIDIVFSVLMFWLLGSGLMFGASWMGWVGTDSFLFRADSPSDAIFLFFQAMFASTAVTIVSGAVAERMKFHAYVLIAILLSGLIYPVYGHWAWHEDGWLAQMGFVDFAGSTVVHGVGAWVGLAGAMLLGPRLGRYRHGRPNYFVPNNYNFIVFGVLVLWVSWFGFNAGSALKFDLVVTDILINTLIAAAGGGLGGYLLSMLYRKRSHVELFAFGMLSGLVAVTAGCHLFESSGAFLVGVSAAFIGFWAGEFVTVRLRVDDPLSVVAVHGAAGIWGTLAVALLAPAGTFEDGRLAQLGVQMVGVLSGFAWAFLAGVVCFAPMRWLRVLRVRPRHEVVGLNVAEHNASMPWVDAIKSITHIMRTGNLEHRLPVERETEIGMVARFMNHLLELIHAKQAELNLRNARLREQASHDALTHALNRRGLEELLGPVIPHQLKLVVILFDIDHFKQVNDRFGHDAGDRVLVAVSRVVQNSIREEDLFVRWGGEEFLVVIRDAALSKGSHVAGLLRQRIEACEIAEVGHVTASFGVSHSTRHHVSFEHLVEDADRALYQAKRSGRNRVVVADPLV